MEKAVEDVENRLDSGVPQEQRRFFAIKLLEKDDKIQEQMKVVPDVSDIIKQLEDSLMILRVLSQMSVMYTFLPLLEIAVQRTKNQNCPYRIRLTEL